MMASSRMARRSIRQAGKAHRSVPFARFSTPATLLVLLTYSNDITAHAFVPPSLRTRGTRTQGVTNFMLSRSASVLPRGDCQERRPHHERQHTKSRLAMRDDGGSEEKAQGKGLGLDGAWEVESGDGHSEGRAVTPPRRGDGVDDLPPGQLPEQTVDGQDWGEWAREWRTDPEGKANRLVKQWETESNAAKAEKRDRGGKSKRGSKAKVNGGVSNGFGGVSGGRATKNAPKGLVVTEVDGEDGQDGQVDWSQGQQLVESDKEKNFAAQWQGEANRLSSLNSTDREQLAVNIRQALGKKSTRSPTTRTKNKKSKYSSKKGNRGASAGSTGFGAVRKEDTVSDRENQATLSLPSPIEESSEDANDMSEVTEADTVKVTQARQHNVAAANSPKEDEPLARARGFGKGVAIVTDSDRNNKESPERPVHPSSGESNTGSDAGGVSAAEERSSRGKAFGSGVFVASSSRETDAGREEGKRGDGNGSSERDESRIRGFGKGVAFPAKGEPKE